MKKIKGIIIGLIIGVVIGLWFGVNIGKDKSIFSNPFADNSIQDKIKQSGEKLIEKSGEVLEKGGKALQDKVNDAESNL